jgi:Flp pilus assembly protein TadB
MEGKDIAMMLVLLALLATVAWVMYLVADTNKRQRRMKAQAELHGRLLDKFSSAREVVEFLQTPGGAQFVDSISSDREEPSSGVLRSTHRGIILVVVGTGCLGLIKAYGWYNNPLLVIGVILLCLGIGFLVSAAVSHRLSKSFGASQATGNTQP